MSKRRNVPSSEFILKRLILCEVVHAFIDGLTESPAMPDDGEESSLRTVCQGADVRVAAAQSDVFQLAHHSGVRLVLQDRNRLMASSGGK